MKSRALAIAALLVSCTKAHPAPPAPAPPDPLAPLRSFEEERRSATSFAEQPLQDYAFGPDPYGIVALPDGRYAGILRGRDSLVLLDRDLHEIVRVVTVRAPSAIALDDKDVLVASEVEPVVRRYRLSGSSIHPIENIQVDARGVRDLVAAKGVIHLVEEHDDRLIEVGAIRRELHVPKGPIRLARTKNAIFVLSLIDHAISAYPLDAKGLIRGEPVKTTIDGPYWSISAYDDVVMAGGVEDHPLDRREGFFGYVDSFVHGYRFTGSALERTFALNVSEHGLIVPKAISLTKSEALVTSYGGTKALRISHDGHVLGAFDFPPGTAALAGEVAANPLLDAWVTKERIVPVDGPREPRSDRDRIGEALFFTGLMAPASRSDGALSRFSCETCHFEGYVDGRTHHTGRGDIRATTKPLVGLFNNRPHFTRALDPDLSAVAENEFRVAGAGSGHDPHFTLSPADVPWLGLRGPELDHVELRRSLMSFLMSWTHRTNPMTLDRTTFAPLEREGAEIFRNRCEACHQARTSTDEAVTRQPFDRWESMIFEGGRIVWASEPYRKTGITPYVHEDGARTTSLRRLYKKRPYFTNGSAADLESALRAVRFDGASFSHAGGDGERLSDAGVGALRAFLDLL